MMILSESDITVNSAQMRSRFARSDRSRKGTWTKRGKRKGINGQIVQVEREGERKGGGAIGNWPRKSERSRPVGPLGPYLVLHQLSALILILFLIMRGTKVAFFITVAWYHSYEAFDGCKNCSFLLCFSLHFLSTFQCLPSFLSLNSSVARSLETM
jgi:hypothetical protein